MSTSATDTTPASHRSTLEPGTGSGAVVVSAFSLSEVRGRGWRGYATIEPGPGVSMSTAEAVRTAMRYQLLPGHAVRLRLARTDAEGVLHTVRVWPSVITEISAWSDPTAPQGWYCRVDLHDPLSALWETTIWGAYRNRSLGRILGGALSLAAGGDGEATLSPILQEFPTIRIEEHLRDTLGALPYVIATGEPLGDWLRNVFGRLGVRIEVRGNVDGTVGLALRDQAPSGPASHTMTLDLGDAYSETNAAIVGLGLNASPHERGAVLDDSKAGPHRRFGMSGPVDQVVDVAGIGLDEAVLRAEFSRSSGRPDRMVVHVRTLQPAIRPGSLLEFTNMSIDGRFDWQTGEVVHTLSTKGYFNAVELTRADEAWREAVPTGPGPTVVSAIVNDGGSESGTPVSRDRLGCIPVTFVFSVGAGVLSFPDPDDPSDAGDGRSEPGHQASPEHVTLPIMEPMAGARHGFVPAHRQGDYCRVLVRHPMSAEIIGFVYNNKRRVNEDAAPSVSAGMLVRHDQGQWSGMFFGPGDEMS